jgi:hypothetical protein
MPTKNMVKSAYSKLALKLSVMVGLATMKKMMKATRPKSMSSR